MKQRVRCASVFVFTATLVACSSASEEPSGSGGATSGGSGSGGASVVGGSAQTGGTPSGGSANGGSANGGSANGGSANGGMMSGGSANGGMMSGGSANGGMMSGGSASGGMMSSGSGGSGGGAGSPMGGSGGSDVVVPNGYKLVWHDEFDVDGAPNPNNWKFEKGFVRNEEAQWYQSDNARVEAGLLVIEARKQRVQNPNYTGTGDWKTTRQYAEYTSSSMHTSGLQSFQYGRFEMRARIPTAAGMWPAWWTLGVSGEWPSNGEIDIMEYYAGKVLANVACGTSTRWQAKWDSATKQLSALGSGWSSQFHVWRMDWDEQNIVLYLDDQQMNTTALSSMLNADGSSPFKQKAYMLVNLAIGGNNGGDPSSAAFPQRYEVDYIRVFQKQ
jgi:beta-glucanase (GH16 family)